MLVRVEDPGPARVYSDMQEKLAPLTRKSKTVFISANEPSFLDKWGSSQRNSKKIHAVACLSVTLGDIWILVLSESFCLTLFGTNCYETCCFQHFVTLSFLGFLNSIHFLILTLITLYNMGTAALSIILLKQIIFI